LAPTTLTRPRSLADQAAEQIRRRIVRGDFQLGEALSETTLAAELGVSKTPIREAFLRLKTEGLVDVQPQRGTFVFHMSAGEVRTLSEFRDVLEISALRLAMQKDAPALAAALESIVADMDRALAGDDAVGYREHDGLFHKCIIDHCGNAYLSESYATIAFRIQALRNRLSRESALNAQSLNEHRMLGEMIGRGGDAKAVAFLKKHIATTAAENLTRGAAVRGSAVDWGQQKRTP
jgi:DNA-binding GntR family transcriptional regulator